MTDYEINTELIAACGLYCGSCRAYILKKCPGCKNNVKAEKRCKTKLCCKDKGIKNCAQCDTYTSYNQYKSCKNLNNFVSKIFGLIFGSDRFACLKYIKDNGEQGFAEHMSQIKSHNRP